MRNIEDLGEPTLRVGICRRRNKKVVAVRMRGNEVAARCDRAVKLFTSKHVTGGVMTSERGIHIRAATSHRLHWPSIGAMHVKAVEAPIGTALAPHEACEFILLEYVVADRKASMFRSVSSVSSSL